MKPEELTPLVRAAQNGDRAAFEQLYAETRGRILTICTRCLGQDAEDAVQEIYLNAWQKLGQLEEPEKFRSWLEQSAANHCRSQYRKNIPVPTEAEIMEQMLAEEDTHVLPEDSIFGGEEREDVLESLRSELSDLQYQTMMLYYYEQRSVREIAEIMGCSEGAVKNRLASARRKLRERAEHPAKKGKKGASMLKAKFIACLGAVIIALGGAGAIAYLQRSAPDTPGDSVIMPTEETTYDTDDKTETESETTAAPDNITEGLPPAAAALYEQGLSLISMMDEMAHSDSYLSLMADSLQDIEEMQRVMDSDYSTQPRVFWAIPTRDFDMNQYYRALGAEDDLGDLSPALRNKLDQKIRKSLLSMLNSREGVNAVGLSSVLSIETALTVPEWETDGMFVYVYENAVPVAVYFTKGEGDAVIADAQFLFDSAFDGTDYRTVAVSLHSAGLEGMGYIFDVGELGVREEPVPTEEETIGEEVEMPFQAE